MGTTFSVESTLTTIINVDSMICALWDKLILDAIGPLQPRPLPLCMLCIYGLGVIPVTLKVSKVYTRLFRKRLFKKVR